MSNHPTMRPIPPPSYTRPPALLLAALCALAFAAAGCSSPTPPPPQRAAAPKLVVTPPPPAKPPEPPPPPDPKPAFEAAAGGARDALAAALKEANTIPPFPKARILLIGDSMAWAIGVALEPHFEKDGHTFKHKTKISDSIRSFSTRKLRDELRKFKPDIVMIVLGSNDYMVGRADERLPKPIKKIAEEATKGGRYCYWIGPPMWQKDTGVVRLLGEHAAPCQFFDSEPLELPRRSDKIHPNKEGSQLWAKLFHDWLTQRPPRRPLPSATKRQAKDRGAAGAKRAAAVATARAEALAKLTPKPDEASP